ncbi:MAG: LytTR family DNA-binding domain-containing protein [Bacteroidales bacterium]
MLEKKIPDYLVTRTNIVRIVVFTAAFALAFINIYAPFGVNAWLNVTQWQLLLYSSLVILTGILVIVISRIIMFLYSRIKNLNHWQYLIWILAEILSMAAVYSVFVKFILDDPREFPDVFRASVKNTSLVLLLPYAILWLYFSWKDKSEKLEKLSEQDYSKEHHRRLVPFHDEKGTMRISITNDDVLFLEAADNYVIIRYIHGDKPEKFMIRNSLKNFQDDLRKYNIVRCHRSYMVNLDKVKVIRKEKDGLHIDLDIQTSLSLPVSSKYSSMVLEAFSKYSTF